MSAISQNGWPALEQAGKPLRSYAIPGVKEHIALRDGCAGFMLIMLATWFNTDVEKIDGKVLDDWGWNFRPIAGSNDISNHASGTAMDLNATKHPQGKRGTFTAKQHKEIEAHLKHLNGDHGVIRWGGNYTKTVDEMHWEINANLTVTNHRAIFIIENPKKFPNAAKVLLANPGLKEVVYS